MIIGISIVKRVLFRGVQQEFSNVYHYQFMGAVTADWASLLAEVRANETQFHSVDVTFVRGQLWSAGGTPSQNAMLYQAEFSGLGSQSGNATMDRERAWLIRWPAGVDSRGKPVFLRKWFHSCGNAASFAPGSPQLQNVSALPDATRVGVANAASAMNEIGVAEAWQLCSPTGREWEAQPECHEFLEHHQLGDMWR